MSARIYMFIVGAMAFGGAVAPASASAFRPGISVHSRGEGHAQPRPIWSQRNRIHFADNRLRNGSIRAIGGVGNVVGGTPVGGPGNVVGGTPAGGLGNVVGGTPVGGLGNVIGGTPAGGLGNVIGGTPAGAGNGGGARGRTGYIGGAHGGG